MRMSNEQRQSRSGRKVTLAVICLKNSFLSQILGFLYLMTSLISALIFFSSLTASSTTFPSTFSLSILNSHLFWLKAMLPGRQDEITFPRPPWSPHCWVPPPASSLSPVPTNPWSVPECRSETLEPRTFNLWKGAKCKEGKLEKYALSSVETKRVRPYSCFLVKLSGG